MRRIRSTLVCDTDVRQVETVGPQSTLEQCAPGMGARHVGSLVVAEKTGGSLRPIGIVTDRDIVLEAVGPQLDPCSLTAGEIVARSLGTARDDDRMDVLTRMNEHGMRRIPVTAQNGELAGTDCMDDVLAAIAEQFSRVVEACAAERTREAETRRATR